MVSERWRAGLWERLGSVRRRESDAPCVWVHAASVGEVVVAKPLVAALQRELPSWEVCVSTNTNTGQEMAKRSLPSLRTFYMPFDLSWTVERTLDCIRPKAIVLVELELWPNFLMAAHRRGIRVLVANGRIMPRSVKAYECLKTLCPPVARAMAAVTYCVQNEEYAQRLEALGIPRGRLHVTGNVKFDSLPACPDAERVCSLAQRLDVRPEDRVLVGGSTWPGEERILLGVYKELRPEFDNLRLVLVPRHVERAKDVEKEIHDAGLKCYRKTALDAAHAGMNGVRQGVLLVDTVGDLVSVYGLATCVFVGKSLVPLGGQNMMEPAAFGRPVLFGPHTFNFSHEVELLLRHGAAEVVKDASELRNRLHALLRDSARATEMGRRAEQVVAANRGATARHMQVFRTVLGQNGVGR
jgi:3-deoxy-D-manno-octulosonic-acid transferase